MDYERAKILAEKELEENEYLTDCIDYLNEFIFFTSIKKVTYAKTAFGYGPVGDPNSKSYLNGDVVIVDKESDNVHRTFFNAIMCDYDGKYSSEEFSTAYNNATHIADPNPELNDLYK